MPLALFTDSTPLTPIRNLFNAIIQQVNKQEIINYADLDALPSTAGLTEGTRAHVDELNVDFQIQDGTWTQTGTARFASTGARDTAYAKASGAYLIAGVKAEVSAAPYIYTGSAWRLNTGGLVLIKSYSFSAASSLTADDFSDAFPAYLLKLRAEFSAAAYLNAVLRAGGSDLTGANYDRQILQGSASAAASAGATGQTSASFMTFAARDRISSSIDITGARAAVATMIDSSAVAHGGGLIVGRYAGVYTPTTVIDGIKLSPSTGTMTGTLDVYGYVR